MTTTFNIQKVVWSNLWFWERKFNCFSPRIWSRSGDAPLPCENDAKSRQMACNLSVFWARWSWTRPHWVCFLGDTHGNKAIDKIGGQNMFHWAILQIKKQNTFADTKTITKFYDAANKTRTLTTETLGQGGPRGLKPMRSSSPPDRSISWHTLTTN